MIAVLVGTRPELIKIAPVLRKLNEEKITHCFIHSDQHYSYSIDSKIIEDLKLRQPDYHLNVGSGTHAVQTGKIMEGVEKICLKVKPKIMIVHGDTNTTLGGALTAKKLHITVAHIEAGLRSFDYKMPEEINRILTDRISDILFAPTQIARKNLLKEGIDNKLIVVTGNTIVDSLKQHLPLVKHSKIIKTLRLKPEQFILVTAHRQENVDDGARLAKLIKLLDYGRKLVNMPVVWPIHPRTRKQVEKYKLQIPPGITFFDPLGYIDMLSLMSNAAFILTDSGGIQEEAYILKKPLITLRDSTERPETLTANFTVDLDEQKLKHAIEAYKRNAVKWEVDVLGDGTASSQIVKILKNFI